MNAYKFYIKEEIKSATRLSSPEIVYNEMRELGLSDQESFWVIYVNTQNQIIGKDMIALGGINYSQVDMKILFRRILKNNAASFFVIHNHPSGELNPSKEDIKLTERIKEIASILQLKLLDHMIIASKGYYSFCERNILCF